MAGRHQGDAPANNIALRIKLGIPHACEAVFQFVLVDLQRGRKTRSRERLASAHLMENRAAEVFSHCNCSDKRWAIASSERRGMGTFLFCCERSAFHGCCVLPLTQQLRRFSSLVNEMATNLRASAIVG